MQISNQRALLVLMLMLRPMSAQPYLPLFPPSHLLPNRICRILQSHFLRRQECQNTRPATCSNMHPTFRQLTGKKKPQMCCSYNHLISTECVATSLKVKCSVSTGREADTYWLTSVMRLSGAPPCPLFTECTCICDPSITMHTIYFGYILINSFLKSLLWNHFFFGVLQIFQMTTTKHVTNDMHPKYWIILESFIFKVSVLCTA